MATHAEIVLNLIKECEPQAVSLSMGYLVDSKCERVLFSDHYGDGTWSPPSERDVKRSRSGRMTAATFIYRDGSRVRYTWSDARGPRWSVQA